MGNQWLIQHRFNKGIVMSDLIPLEEFTKDSASNLIPLDQFGGEVKGIKLTGTTSRSATNNNPLNLEYRPGSYQDKYGAELEPVSISGKQRFAKFPTMAAGYQAGLDQIQLDSSRGLTLSAFVKKFAPPHENPTDQIISQYAKHLGVSPDTPLLQIEPEKLIVPMLERESSTKVVRDKGWVESVVDSLGPNSAKAAEEKQLIPLERFVESKDSNLVPLEEFTKSQETFAPTKDQAEASARTGGVEPEPGLEQPTFLDPVNIIGGLPSIGRTAAGSLVGALTTKSGLTAMAKALPGFLGSEAVGGAVYSGLEGDKTVPEWAKLPLAMAAGVGGGLTTSKLREIGRGVKIGLNPKNPLPDEEVVLSELTQGLKSGLSAKETLEQMGQKYGVDSRDFLMPRVLARSVTAKPITPMAKNPLDSSELGAPVVTKSLKTEVDSTLGPAGTVVDTIPLNEGHVDMRLKFGKVGDGKDIQAPRLMNWKNTFKTNDRIFSELDNIAPGFKQEFQGKLNMAENIAHNNVKQLFTDVDRVANILPKNTGDKIGINLIAQRRSGMDKLNAMGKTVEPLTMEERQVSNDFQLKFHDYLVRINEARALSNQQPIKEDPNYITFMHNFVEKVNEGTNPITASASAFAIPKVPFKYAKTMLGGEKSIETNLFTIFKNYAALAERAINLSPHLEKIAKFVGPMEVNGVQIPALNKIAPNAAAALTAMAQTISGVKPPMNNLERMLTKASENLVISTLGAYPRSVANQIGSLAAGSAETGIGNMIKGLSMLLKPGAIGYAAKNSNVLAQRKMDVVLEELGKSWVNSISKSAKHYAMLPLEIVDHLMATGTWFAAVKKGLQSGMSEVGAHNFADEVVTSTQASASAINRAMVQNSAVGKLVTAFQTFSIADANWIARNILGKGNINFKTMEGFKKLVKITVVGMALNNLQRGVLGMPPGLPEPFHAMSQAMDRGAGPIETITEGVKELGSLVPVVGGSLAYGKTPLGALASLTTDVATGYKTPIEALAMLSGIPGMNMFIKGLKTPEGLRLKAQIERDTGLPIGPTHAPTTPPSNLKEILLGKEPQLKRKKMWHSDEALLRLLRR